MRRTPKKVKMVSMSHCFNEMRAYPWGQALIFFRHHRHACLISSSKSAWRWARSSASSTHKLALCLQSHLVKIKMKIESKLLINIYLWVHFNKWPFLSYTLLLDYFGSCPSETSIFAVGRQQDLQKPNMGNHRRSYRPFREFTPLNHALWHIVISNSWIRRIFIHMQRQ